MRKPIQQDMFFVKGAAFSDCRKYRFCLWRIWDKSKSKVMFIGLNPSKADEGQEDNTIHKVRHIAENNGFGGFYMLNLFPFISTDPKQLQIAPDQDIMNRFWLKFCAEETSKIIFAWGNFKVAHEKAKEIIAMFPEAWALKINKNGSPRHPLFVDGKIELVPFKSPHGAAI